MAFFFLLFLLLSEGLQSVILVVKGSPLRSFLKQTSAITQELYSAVLVVLVYAVVGSIRGTFLPSQPPPQNIVKNNLFMQPIAIKVCNNT